MNTREPTVGLFVLLLCVLVMTAGCGKKSVRGVSGYGESADVSAGTSGDAENASTFNESLETLENDLSPGETMEAASSGDQRARTTEKAGTHATAFGQAADAGSAVVGEGGTHAAAPEQAVDNSAEGNAGNGTTGQAAPHKGVSFSHGLQDVYFAFNSWQLSEQARQVLEANAEWIKSHSRENLTIEGHCDERGTRAYNYALGEKRATMVKQYLTFLGVPEHQMMVVSFGKDRPMCREFSDECFQVNRRAHFAADVNTAAR